jgi:hypothetical protein
MREAGFGSTVASARRSSMREASFERARTSLRSQARTTTSPDSMQAKSVTVSSAASVCSAVTVGLPPLFVVLLWRRPSSAKLPRAARAAVPEVKGQASIDRHTATADI